MGARAGDRFHHHRLRGIGHHLIEHRNRDAGCAEPQKSRLDDPGLHEPGIGDERDAAAEPGEHDFAKALDRARRAND